MKTIESLQRWLKANGARSGRGPSWSSMFMTKWVKRMATYAILFAWSIPGPAFALTFPRISEALERPRMQRDEIGTKDDGLKDDQRKKLQQIREWAKKKIDRAAMDADRSADSALQIRSRYPDNKAPVDVENHIQASDAARQEVKQLQGTIDENTLQETVKNATRAENKAKEAEHEYKAADEMARSN